MQCPQCNTELGEGAKACATCGWSASKKTLWIVLGSIAAFIFLVCCGLGTWGYMKAKKVVEAVQGDITPLQIKLLHAQVANYAQKKGRAPATLEEAAAEPLVGKSGEKVQINMQSNNKAADMYGHAIRFTQNPDRSFEVRSAGKDGTFDNGDDVFEKGTLDDDLNALIAEIEVLGKKMRDSVVRAFGGDPSKLDAPPAGGGDGGGPAGGTQGGGGGK
jgi:hypothetical protein